MSQLTINEVFGNAYSDGDCILWGLSSNTGGYAQANRMVAGKKKTYRLHRFVYETLVGAIPKGLHLDHLCRTRHCINPEHLEPVTNRENLLRGETWAAKNAAKTHCPRGHLYDKINNRNQRYCTSCAKEHNAKTS